MKYDPLLWDQREVRAAGPGSNRTRAKARRLAKVTGNRKIRRNLGEYISDACT